MWNLTTKTRGLSPARSPSSDMAGPADRRRRGHRGWGDAQAAEDSRRGEERAERPARKRAFRRGERRCPLSSSAAAASGRIKYSVLSSLVSTRNVLAVQPNRVSAASPVRRRAGLDPQRDSTEALGAASAHARDYAASTAVSPSPPPFSSDVCALRACSVSLSSRQSTGTSSEALETAAAVSQQSRSPPSFLSLLPPCLVAELGGFLAPADLVAVSSSARDFRWLAHCQALWRRLCFYAGFAVWCGERRLASDSFSARRTRPPGPLQAAAETRRAAADAEPCRAPPDAAPTARAASRPRRQESEHERDLPQLNWKLIFILNALVQGRRAARSPGGEGNASRSPAGHARPSPSRLPPPRRLRLEASSTRRSVCVVVRIGSVDLLLPLPPFSRRIVCFLRSRSLLPDAGSSSASSTSPFPRSPSPSRGRASASERADALAHPWAPPARESLLRRRLPPRERLPGGFRQAEMPAAPTQGQRSACSAAKEETKTAQNPAKEVELRACLGGEKARGDREGARSGRLLPLLSPLCGGTASADSSCLLSAHTRASSLLAPALGVSADARRVDARRASQRAETSSRTLLQLFPFERLARKSPCAPSFPPPGAASLSAAQFVQAVILPLLSPAERALPARLRHLLRSGRPGLPVPDSEDVTPCQHYFFERPVVHEAVSLVARLPRHTAAEGIDAVEAAGARAAGGEQPSRCPGRGEGDAPERPRAGLTGLEPSTSSSARFEASSVAASCAPSAPSRGALPWYVASPASAARALPLTLDSRPSQSRASVVFSSVSFPRSTSSPRPSSVCPSCGSPCEEVPSRRVCVLDWPLPPSGGVCASPQSFPELSRASEPAQDAPSRWSAPLLSPFSWDSPCAGPQPAPWSASPRRSPERRETCQRRLPARPSPGSRASTLSLDSLPALPLDAPPLSRSVWSRRAPYRGRRRRGLASGVDGSASPQESAAESPEFSWRRLRFGDVVWGRDRTRAPSSSLQDAEDLSFSESDDDRRASPSLSRVAQPRSALSGIFLHLSLPRLSQASLPPSLSAASSLFSFLSFAFPNASRGDTLHQEDAEGEGDRTVISLLLSPLLGPWLHPQNFLPGAAVASQATTLVATALEPFLSTHPTATAAGVLLASLLAAFATSVSGALTTAAATAAAAVVAAHGGAGACSAVAALASAAVHSDYAFEEDDEDECGESRGLASLFAFLFLENSHCSRQLPPSGAAEHVVPSSQGLDSSAGGGPDAAPSRPRPPSSLSAQPKAATPHAPGGLPTGREVDAEETYEPQSSREADQTRGRRSAGGGLGDGAGTQERESEEASEDGFFKSHEEGLVKLLLSLDIATLFSNISLSSWLAACCQFVALTRARAALDVRGIPLVAALSTASFTTLHAGDNPAAGRELPSTKQEEDDEEGSAGASAETWTAESREKVPAGLGCGLSPPALGRSETEEEEEHGRDETPFSSCTESNGEAFSLGTRSQTTHTPQSRCGGAHVSHGNGTRRAAAGPNMPLPRGHRAPLVGAACDPFACSPLARPPHPPLATALIHGARLASSQASPSPSSRRACSEFSSYVSSSFDATGASPSFSTSQQAWPPGSRPQPLSLAALHGTPAHASASVSSQSSSAVRTRSVRLSGHPRADLSRSPVVSRDPLRPSGSPAVSAVSPQGLSVSPSTSLSSSSPSSPSDKEIVPRRGAASPRSPSSSSSRSSSPLPSRSASFSLRVPPGSASSSTFGSSSSPVSSAVVAHAPARDSSALLWGLSWLWPLLGVSAGRLTPQKPLRAGSVAAAAGLVAWLAIAATGSAGAAAAFAAAASLVASGGAALEGAGWLAGGVAGGGEDAGDQEGRRERARRKCADCRARSSDDRMQDAADDDLADLRQETEREEGVAAGALGEATPFRPPRAARRVECATREEGEKGERSGRQRQEAVQPGGREARKKRQREKRMQRREDGNSQGEDEEIRDERGGSDGAGADREAAEGRRRPGKKRQRVKKKAERQTHARKRENRGVEPGEEERREDWCARRQPSLRDTGGPTARKRQRTASEERIRERKTREDDAGKEEETGATERTSRTDSGKARCEVRGRKRPRRSGSELDAARGGGERGGDEAAGAGEDRAAGSGRRRASCANLIEDEGEERNQRRGARAGGGDYGDQLTTGDPEARRDGGNRVADAHAVQRRQTPPRENDLAAEGEAGEGLERLGSSEYEEEESHHEGERRVALSRKRSLAFSLCLFTNACVSGLPPAEPTLLTERRAAADRAYARDRVSSGFACSCSRKGDSCDEGERLLPPFFLSRLLHAPLVAAQQLAAPPAALLLFLRVHIPFLSRDPLSSALARETCAGVSCAAATETSEPQQRLSPAAKARSLASWASFSSPSPFLPPVAPPVRTCACCWRPGDDGGAPGAAGCAARDREIEIGLLLSREATVQHLLIHVFVSLLERGLLPAAERVHEGAALERKRPPSRTVRGKTKGRQTQGETGGRVGDALANAAAEQRGSGAAAGKTTAARGYVGKRREASEEAPVENAERSLFCAWLASSSYATSATPMLQPQPRPDARLIRDCRFSFGERLHVIPSPVFLAHAPAHAPPPPLVLKLGSGCAASSSSPFSPQPACACLRASSRMTMAAAATADSRPSSGSFWPPLLSPSSQVEADKADETCAKSRAEPAHASSPSVSPSAPASPLCPPAPVASSPASAPRVSSLSPSSSSEPLAPQTARMRAAAAAWLRALRVSLDARELGAPGVVLFRQSESPSPQRPGQSDAGPRSALLAESLPSSPQPSPQPSPRASSQSRSPFSASRPEPLSARGQVQSTGGQEDRREAEEDSRRRLHVDSRNGIAGDNLGDGAGRQEGEGATLSAATEGGELRRETDAARPRASSAPRRESALACSRRLLASTAGVRQFEFHPDIPEVILTGHRDGSIRIVDCVRDVATASLPVDSGPILGLAWLRQHPGRLVCGASATGAPYYVSWDVSRSPLDDAQRESRRGRVGRGARTPTGGEAARRGWLESEAGEELDEETRLRLSSSDDEDPDDRPQSDCEAKRERLARADERERPASGRVHARAWATAAARSSPSSSTWFSRPLPFDSSPRRRQTSARQRMGGREARPGSLLLPAWEGALSSPSVSDSTLALRGSPGPPAARRRAAVSSSSSLLRVVHTGVSFDQQLSSLSVSCTDDFLLLSGFSPDLSLHDLATGRRLGTLHGLHSGTVNTVRFSSTSPHLFATASFDHTCKLWDLRQRIGLTPCAWRGSARGGGLGAFTGGGLTPRGTLGDFVAGRGESGAAAVPVQTFSTGSPNVMCAFSDDGRWLLCSGVDTVLKQYALPAFAATPHRFDLPPARTNATANFRRAFYLRGGRRLVTAGTEESVVRVFEAASGDSVGCVSFAGLLQQNLSQRRAETRGWSAPQEGRRPSPLRERFAELYGGACEPDDTTQWRRQDGLAAFRLRQGSLDGERRGGGPGERGIHHPRATQPERPPRPSSRGRRFVHSAAERTTRWARGASVDAALSAASLPSSSGGRSLFGRARVRLPPQRSRRRGLPGGGGRGDVSGVGDSTETETAAADSSQEESWLDSDSDDLEGSASAMSYQATGGAEDAYGAQRAHDGASSASSVFLPLLSSPEVWARATAVAAAGREFFVASLRELLVRFELRLHQLNLPSAWSLGEHGVAASSSRASLAAASEEYIQSLRGHPCDDNTFAVLVAMSGVSPYGREAEEGASGSEAEGSERGAGGQPPGAWKHQAFVVLTELSQARRGEYWS